MIVLHHDWGSLYVDTSLEGNPQDWFELDAFFHTNFLAFMMLNRGFYPVFHTWLERRREEFGHVLTIFSGHAGRRQGKWILKTDNAAGQTAQKFVDAHDGKAMLILLLCCNPRNLGRVTSKKSLIVYSRSALSLGNMQRRRSRQILHIPDHGDFIGTTQQKQLMEIARHHGYQSTPVHRSP